MTKPPTLDAAEELRLQEQAKSERLEQRTKARVKRLERSQETVHGLLPFIEINPDLTVIREPQGYDETLAFKDKVTAYFETDMELFPDFHFPGFPNRFFRTFRQEIGEKFDTDSAARSRCGLLRHVIITNITWLLALKSLLVLLVSWILLAALYISTTYSKTYVGIELFSTKFSVPIAVWRLSIYTILFLSFLGLSQALYIAFSQSTDRSCFRMGRHLQSVFKGIESAYNLAINRIQADENLGGNDLKDQWPERAAWWSRLILWYPKRVEYLERTFQIEMWRVRYWLAVTRTVSIPIALGLSLTLLLVAWIIRDKLGWVEMGFFTGFVVLLTVASLRYWNANLRRIQIQVGTEHWNRFATFRSDNKLADMMREDKQKIIFEQRHP